jgi:hypothetical protein
VILWSFASDDFMGLLIFVGESVDDVTRVKKKLLLDEFALSL